MSFRCPDCGKGDLKIVSRIELRRDSKWDEIALQMLRCGSCGFEGIATYQENRWGSLDSEIVHHYGYRATAAVRMRIRDLIEACPDAGNDKCACPSCEELNATNANGVWNWLEREDVAEEVGGIFEIVRG